jgi:hypothetical protein
MGVDAEPHPRLLRVTRRGGRAASRSPHTPGKDQVLISDASLKGIGAILCEENRPVRIISRKLSLAERNYDTTEREMLAVVWAMEKLFLIIDTSRMITIKSNHANLLRSYKPSESNR